MPSPIVPDRGKKNLASSLSMFCGTSPCCPTGLQSRHLWPHREVCSPFQKEIAAKTNRAPFLSGKSSVLLALLRLLTLQKGTIHIDNLNLSNIPLSILRTRLACLHQDAISLPGSVRCNLLPFLSPGTNSTSPSVTKLTSALTKARIWHVISARGGLDADFASMNLSPGQKQLFCLVAAVLRRAKVVLLDEVTGCLDQETDAEVRKVLDEGLKGVLCWRWCIRLR